MKFKEVIKELLAKDIRVLKVKATLNGAQAYKVKSSKYNPAALWTAEQIKRVYEHGEF